MPIEATQARWQTLVGVLHILAGWGGRGEGGMIYSVMEAVQRASYTECSVKSCCSAASCQLQLLLNSICTQPDGVTKILHSGPGQYSMVHLSHLFVDASFHLVCVTTPPPPPNHTVCMSCLPALCPHHRVHRVAIAAFWRTFSHEGKISAGWWGWGVHSHPLSLHLPSPVKMQCTLQLSGQTH